MVFLKWRFIAKYIAATDTPVSSDTDAGRSPSTRTLFIAVMTGYDVLVVDLLTVAWKTDSSIMLLNFDLTLDFENSILGTISSQAFFGEK